MIDDFLSNIGRIFAQGLSNLLNGFGITNIVPHTGVAVLLQESTAGDHSANLANDGGSDVGLFQFLGTNVEVFALSLVHHFTKLHIPGVGVDPATSTGQDVVSVGEQDGPNSPCRHPNTRSPLRHALSGRIVPPVTTSFGVGLVLVAVWLLLLLLLLLLKFQQLLKKKVVVGAWSTLSFLAAVIIIVVVLVVSFRTIIRSGSKAIIIAVVKHVVGEYVIGLMVVVRR